MMVSTRPPMTDGSPRVSVIITTHARPHLVGRAVASALAQTLRPIEVVVVVDGPDPATIAALEQARDDRVSVHVRATCGGQGAAINTGIRQARSPWVALLDDDDEWMPEKLETQLALAEASTRDHPIVGCYFLARSDERETLWPLRAPQRDEPVCEYLFCRTQFSFGEGILPTSTLFASRTLFESVPMGEGMSKHCDIDWLVRADAEPNTELLMPADRSPLAIWHLGGADRLSKEHDWRFSSAWIAKNRPLVSARAYAGFLLTWASFSARSQRDLRAVWPLVRDAFRRGRPSLKELVVYAAVWGLPLEARTSLSRVLVDETRKGASN